MKEVKLKELVTEVNKGLQVRSPIDQNAPVMQVINIKDLQEGRVDVSSLEKREVVSGKDSRITAIKEKDILISVKGSQLKVAVVDKAAEGLPISSNIVSIRLDNSRAIPEVVSAYLNSPNGQQRLRIKSRGSTIPSISLNDLLDVTIPLPKLEQQLVFRDYLDAVNHYLMTLKKEEQMIRDTKNYIISQHLR